MPYGGPDAAAAPVPAPARRGRQMFVGLAAIALVSALLAGGVGGAVGYSLADRGGGSSGVLGQPLPGFDEAAAPIGPVEAVAERVLPSVVQLRVEGAGAAGEGSGMVLSDDGLLLTNNHVVEAASDGGVVTVLFQDGATARAQIVGRDPSSDLAVIRAQGVSGLTPIELGNSDSVRVGQQVVAFGSPLGLGGTVTTGIISALDRPVSVGGAQGASEETVLNALQTDAAINPGNSGGPLVDMQGRLIGINSAIATTGNEGGSIGVGFSIPVNQAKRVAEELERTGKASRAVLGVNVGTDPRVSGARIESVEPGSAAETGRDRGGGPRGPLRRPAHPGRRRPAGGGAVACARRRGGGPAGRPDGVGHPRHGVLIGVRSRCRCAPSAVDLGSPGCFRSRSPARGAPRPGRRDRVGAGTPSPRRRDLRHRPRPLPARHPGTTPVIRTRGLGSVGPPLR